MESNIVSVVKAEALIPICGRKMSLDGTPLEIDCENIMALEILQTNNKNKENLKIS